MIKKFNKYLNSSIITSIIFMLLGIIILLFPKISLNVFCYFIAIIAIIIGIYLILFDIRNNEFFFSITINLFGIMLLLLGIIILVNPNFISILIPICLGIWFISGSVLKFKFTVILKDIRSDNLWISSFLMTLLSVICGLTFIINPIKTSSFLTSILGFIIIIYSISDICEMIILKRNINKISKSIKENYKIIN